MENKELKVGILVVITGVILYFGFNFLKGDDMFSTTNKFTAYYENIDGLTVSNPVIVNGFSVGRVKSIELTKRENVRVLEVIIDVRDDIPVGNSTVAVLSSVDMLGAKAIVLKLGESSELYTNGDVLKSELEASIVSKLEKRAEPILNSLDTTISNFKTLMDDDNKKSIKNILHNLDNTTAVMEKMAVENRKTFNIIGNQMSVLMASFAETEKKIKPLLDNLNTFTDSLNAMNLAKTMANVESAIINMNEIMKKVNSTDGSIGMMMNDKEMYNNMNTSLKSLDELLLHFNTNPNHFMAPLGKTKKQIEKEKRKEEKKKK